MAISFPANPSIGDEFTASGYTWVWSGISWEKVAATVPVKDFSINVSAGTNNTYQLDKAYPAGGYAISSGSDDLSIDIYLLSSNTLVGSSSTRAVTATAEFDKVIILGQTVNDVLGFTYTGSAISSSSSGDFVAAGAYINSVNPVGLPNINDSTVVSGGNFATNVEVSFKGSDNVVRPAKGIVRSNSKSLIVTRPDVFPVQYGPYSAIVSNPGVPNPTGSGSHILTNAVNAGTFATWVTGDVISYPLGSAFSESVVASDVELSTQTYSIVSGTLPTGLSMSSAGLITGTSSQTAPTSVTIRATDAGGNYVEKTFSVSYALTWTTTAASFPSPLLNVPYLFQLQATDPQAATPTYSIVSGTLPTGLSMSAAGLITGTPTSGGTSVTFKAMVASGALSTVTVNMATVSSFQTQTFLSSGTFTVPAGVTKVTAMIISGGGGGGQYTGNSSVGTSGGGAGGYVLRAFTVTPGSNFSVAVGAGGGATSSGGTTTVNGYSVIGGGNGATSGQGGSGACGGGSGSSDAGIGTIGKNGGLGSFQYYAGSGGGMTTAGSNSNSGPGGAGLTLLGVDVCGGGGAGGANSGGPNTSGAFGGGSGGGGSAVANTGSGGGGSGYGSIGGSGGSGKVIVAW